MLFVLGLLLVSNITATSLVKAGTKTIVVPDDYATITDAVGNATDGDTILVRRGEYQENVLKVNKSLSIIGENTATTRILLHPPSHPLFDSNIMIFDNAIQINANHVVISGFSITTEGGAIYFNSEACQILENNLSIEVSGKGDRTQIIGNNFSGLSPSSYISITGSNQLIAKNNLNGGGINCEGAFNSILNNTMTLSQSVYEWGIQQGSFIQGIQLSGNSNLVLYNTISYGGIYLDGDSDYNFIEKNNCGFISISR